MGGWTTDMVPQEPVKAATIEEQMGAAQAAADGSLAEQIKALQRSDPAARNAWAEFVAANSHNGTKDPHRYTDDTLQQFLMHYNENYAGKPTVGMPVADPNSSANLPECTKLLQKSSRNIRIAWTQYCSVHGRGINDPLRHEPSFHVGFYDCLAKNVVPEGTSSYPSAAAGGWGKGDSWGKGGKGGMDSWGGKGGGMGGMKDLARMASMAFSAMQGGTDSWGADSWGGGAGAPPAKKMRTDSGMAAPTSTGDAVKDTLIQAIKGYQRTSEQAKQEWWAYADQYLGGTRDPARQETEALQTFCQMYNVNPLAYAGVPAGMKSAVPEDPQKAPLVNLIKAYQKSGEEAKQIWGQFAGETRDPARHTMEKLMEFCQLYGLGA